jgi:4-hydroxybenzoate polyprenyltransferase
MNRLKALLSLIRLRHTGQVVGIVTVLSVKRHGFTVESLLAIASFLFLFIALYSFDDAHDSVGDKLIHPNRPIPTGVLTVNQAYLFGTLFFFLGVTSAYNLLLIQFVLFLVVAVLGFAVIFLKLTSMVRAIFTAVMIFLLFPFSMSVSSKSLLFGLIVALPHVAGSITKDFIHLEGDERVGLQPPAYWTRYVASGLFFICGGIILLPIILNVVSWHYIPLIVPTLVSCLILGYKVFNQQYPKVYIYGGIGMLSALVAFSINI